VRSIQRLLVVATRPEGDEDLDQRKKKIDEEFHFSVSVRCLPRVAPPVYIFCTRPPPSKADPWPKVTRPKATRPNASISAVMTPIYEFSCTATTFISRFFK
jgi:hypothetical protein